MSNVPAMTEGEAEELQKFRRNIEAADLEELCAVVASTLDTHVDLLRSIGTPHALVEMAVSLACEMRVRRRHLEGPTRMMGNC